MKAFLTIVAWVLIIMLVLLFSGPALILAVGIAVGNLIFWFIVFLLVLALGWVASKLE